MPVRERQRRHADFLRRVQSWTARDWLSAQLADLGVPEGKGDSTIEAFRRGRRRSTAH
jgi:hypothetical protein